MLMQKSKKDIVVWLLKWVVISNTNAIKKIEYKSNVKERSFCLGLWLFFENWLAINFLSSFVNWKSGFKKHLS